MKTITHYMHPFFFSIERTQKMTELYTIYNLNSSHYNERRMPKFAHFAISFKKDETFFGAYFWNRCLDLKPLHLSLNHISHGTRDRRSTSEVHQRLDIL